MDPARQIPSHGIKEIQFGVYTSEEIKALSVLPVTNPQCVDLLGHAVASGLHDPRMGAVDRGARCPTCYEPSRSCIGHVGHINLPVPIINPLFFRTVVQILQGSCFHCKAINCDKNKAMVLLLQMKALDRDNLSVAMDIASYAQNFTATNPLEKLMDENVALEDNLKEMLEHLLPDQKGNILTATTQTREQRKKILADFMHYQWKRNKPCLACANNNWKVSANPYMNKIAYKFGIARANKEPKAKKPRAKKSAISGGKGKKGPAANAAPEASPTEPEGSPTLADEAKPTEVAVPTATEIADITKDLSVVRFTAMDARLFLREVFTKNNELLRRMFSLLDNGMEFPTDMFFMDTLLVPPNRFRPERVMGESRYAHVSTKNLERIIVGCNNIRILRKLIQDGENVKKVAGYVTLERIPGKTLEAKFHEACALLQTSVNCIADGDADRLNAEFATGIKQVLEKKEGLFRMHMMGKRVNFSARSVISPDPYINLNEIGVPLVFAMKLTYPVVITTNNLEQMRKAVMNGPDIYPGATHVEYDDHTVVKLSPHSKNQRDAEAKALMISSGRLGGPKKVYRHLINGDIMLLNRQPTLHKTSIMAHKARILQSEKTLRLHYANCKSYNADFDGDEMNAHLPQDEISRSEAYNIVNASYQYLVAKDGTPLSGLIQDHIVAGVHLTMRGKFFEKSDYEQLVYSAVGDIVKTSIKFLPPSIIKPKRLWSGKQIISTIVINLIPPQFSPVSLRTASKVPLKSWNRTTSTRKTKKSKKSPRFMIALKEERDMTESDVIFRNGELVCGVLDKAQFGPSSYGLVHACFELYGGDISALLLSGLARLFTVFLQMHGFSLGVEDILISPNADFTRRTIMEQVEASGDSVVIEAFGLDSDTATPAVLKDRIERAHRDVDQSDMQLLDGMTERKVNEFNSSITNACIPYGLYKGFPHNHLQMMVLSGAKGAQVNAIQMSCLLGQITLEGTRPPLMLSGRTLPSFAPYAATPRSGGFVMQRFGTGLRPQEYFFHCMAGREGLIDTAVKTSRSGYLQRCIIKHLEGVMVNYDMTVRDSDSTVVQFLYGEDGLDIGRLPFYTEKQLPFLMTNSSKEMVAEIKQLKSMIGSSFPDEHEKKINSWRKDVKSREKREFHHSKPASDVLQRWNLGKVTRVGKVGTDWHSLVDIVDPTISLYRPDSNFGAISERMRQVMDDYMKHPPAEVAKATSMFKAGTPVEDVVKDLISFKYVKSVCQPGEAVGALAAQSIGEPSTQMTLNTFHFAGRGEMNVTLGIPRLREILMTASKTIRTPTMEVPVRPGMELKAEALRVKLNRVMFEDVVECFDISTNLVVQPEMGTSFCLCLFVRLLPPAEMASRTCLSNAKILAFFEKTVVKRLVDAINAKISLKKAVKSGKRGKKGEEEDEEGGGEVDLDGPGGDDDDDAAEPAGGDRGKKKGETEDDVESVNSDGEDADPEAAKAQFVEDGDYTGDQDDTALEEELEAELEAETEGDDESEDKENSVMDDSTSGIGDSAEPPVDTPLKASAVKRSDRDKSPKPNPFRVEYVIGLDPWIKNYTYNAKDNGWCQLTFSIPVTNTVLDPQSLIETELKKAVLYQAPNIKKGFLSRNNTGTMVLKTEGVNFDYLLRFADILDVNRLYSNDIQAVASRFGIEAAARTIIMCNEVFGAYGIDVNYRHLSLVSDYMSVNGAIRAFNRVALTTNASPFQKMSFETSMTFYKDAVLTGASDNIKSPSAQLVVGERLKIGTGIFSLRQPLSLR